MKITKRSTRWGVFSFKELLMQTLIVNGKEKHFDDGQFPNTISDLLNHLNIVAATVVVEMDGQIINREKFDTTKLQPNQSLELIRFVGGG